MHRASATRLALPFCDRRDKAQKLEQKLREQERILISESINKSDPNFSTVGKAAKAGKYRILVVQVVTFCGLLLLYVVLKKENRDNLLQLLRPDDLHLESTPVGLVHASGSREARLSS